MLWNRRLQKEIECFDFLANHRVTHNMFGIMIRKCRSDMGPLSEQGILHNRDTVGHIEMDDRTIRRKRES